MRYPSTPPKRKQKGATLIITLVIALLSLLALLASVSTTYSTQATTTNAQSLLASHELANTTANKALEALIALKDKNTSLPPWYFSTNTPPSPSSWDSVAPSSYLSGATARLQAKFIIVRQCDPSATITDITKQCTATPTLPSSTPSTQSNLQSTSTSSEKLIDSNDTSYIIFVQIIDNKSFLQNYSFQVSPSS